MSMDETVPVRRKPGRPAGLKTEVRATQRESQRPQPFKLRTAANRFEFDTSRIPRGMTYQWNTVSVKGMRQEETIADNLANGWRAVPKIRHPELSGISDPNDAAANEPLERGGQQLMERDVSITKMAKEMDAEAARDQVNTHLRRLQLGQDGSNTKKRVKVERQYVPMADDE